MRDRLFGLGRLAVAGAVGVVLASCGTSDGPGAGDPAVTVSLPPGMSQPFELLKVGQFDRLHDLVAQFQVSCATRHGVAVPAIPSSSATTGFIVSRRDFGYLTEDEVRARGLRPGPATSTSTDAKLTAAQAAELTRCMDEAQRLLGPEYQQVSERMFALMNDMVDRYAAAMRPKVEQADARVQRCVVDDGWRPALPDKLGSEDVSAAALFGVPLGRQVTDAQTGKTTYVPSAREIDLALALLRCAVKLGTPDQLLADAKRIQAPVVASHELEIRTLNADLEALVRKAATALR